MQISSDKFSRIKYAVIHIKGTNFGFDTAENEPSKDGPDFWQRPRSCAVICGRRGTRRPCKSRRFARLRRAQRRGDGGEVSAHGGALVDDERGEGQRLVEEHGGLQEGEDVHDEVVGQRQRP